ncbi:MAG: bifunctional precorrin-2 dehydrogenase/sirohydrochlorin ferrochelatase [Tannerella sp.]|nr:bifunctional precorrin-2 dehydrogenase/sirohydrochlorin ferrochelatase [Tannerella sp.]
MMAHENLNFLPVSLNIADKKLLIIGGGKVALHKTLILNKFTDNISIVSPEFHEGFDALPFTKLKQKYSPEVLQDAFIIYICTGDKNLNAQIKSDAAERNILACVCDNPALCDFISPAVHREEHFTIAVSSDGRNVRRSIAIRNQISELINKGILKLYD